MHTREMEHHFRLIKDLARPGGPLATGSPKATVNQDRFGAWVGDRWFPSEERDQLHRFIVATQRVGTSTGSGAQHAVVMSGPPGVGKSTARARHLNAAAGAYQVVDADGIKEDLIRHSAHQGSLDYDFKTEEVLELERRGAQFRPMEFASLVHTESVLIANQLKADVLGNQGNVVLDQVLSDQKQALAMGTELQERGYRITVINVEASREVVEARILKRYLEQNEADPVHGGRGIPSDVLDWTYRHGRDDVSVARDISKTLAESNPHVIEYQQWRTTTVDAAPHHEATFTRAQIGAPLVRQSAAAPGGFPEIGPDGAARLPNSGPDGQGPSVQ